MGTILQERVPQQCLERVSIREREWKRKASWINSRPNVGRWVFVFQSLFRRHCARRCASSVYPLKYAFVLPMCRKRSRHVDAVIDAIYSCFYISFAHSYAVLFRSLCSIFNILPSFLPQAIKWVGGSHRGSQCSHNACSQDKKTTMRR